MTTVTRAGPADEEPARALRDGVFAALRTVYRPTETARQRRAAEHPGNTSRLIVRQGEGIVGTVEYVIEGSEVTLSGLAVNPACRGHGIGKALVFGVISEGRREGCRHLRLSTVKETGAWEWFRRRGFKVVSEGADPLFESPAGGPVTTVRMALEIWG